MNDKYINHSGGASGADSYWEKCGKRYNVKTIAYSFNGHNTRSANPYILSSDELAEGWEVVKSVSKYINRNLPHQKYVQNLLSRNWFQVKNSSAIYAIGKIDRNTNKHVKGGTGWAVQMAITYGKPVFIFDQIQKSWFIYNISINQFSEIDYIPTLTKDFAGIGTRELSFHGGTAIDAVYKETFENG